MLRVASFLALVTGWFGLTAFWAADPRFDDGSFAVNTTVAHFFHASSRQAPRGVSPSGGPADTTAALRMLMLNYSAYDSAYVGKLRRCLQRQFPASGISDFWEGTPEALRAELTGRQVVLIAYPSGGTPAVLRAYGQVLQEYVHQGGVVVFTGTHEYGVLQRFNLFDLDFGYFCAGPQVHENATDHPIFEGTPADFNLSDYAYPLDISDPGFVTLADVRGYPVLGYKPHGAGKILYLGFEYYFDDPVSARILTNAVQWAVPKTQPAPPAKKENWSSQQPARRTEEVLYAGRNAPESLDIRIYPNPYTVKATLEFELGKTTTVALDMTDETGRPAAELLRPRSLNPGMYRFELPNLAPGVYFVKCRSGDQTTVRKVVKMSAP